MALGIGHRHDGRIVGSIRGLHRLCSPEPWVALISTKRSRWVDQRTHSVEARQRLTLLGNAGWSFNPFVSPRCRLGNPSSSPSVTAVLKMIEATEMQLERRGGLRSLPVIHPRRHHLANPRVNGKGGVGHLLRSDIESGIGPAAIRSGADGPDKVIRSSYRAILKNTVARSRCRCPCR